VQPQSWGALEEATSSSGSEMPVPHKLLSGLMKPYKVIFNKIMYGVISTHPQCPTAHFTLYFDSEVKQGQYAFLTWLHIAQLNHSINCFVYSCIKMYCRLSWDG